MKRTLLIWTAAILAAVLFLATGPPASVPASPPADRAESHVVRGAFHVHTTRSDGALGKREVARAAAEAGLQFAIFTDHGDGTRPPDPPEYVDGVLCLDGVEISTNGGHYVAIGMAAAPYPLGGDADAVAEDVARLGGFGIAAHPASARRELAWTADDVPVDGFEWLNADSEWRDETRLRIARTMIDYLWRPAPALASLFDRPVAALERWDALTRGRRVVGIGAHDAHGGLGAERDGTPGRRVHVPSYEATFRTFSVHAVLDAPFAGDGRRDAERLIDAIRNGRAFTAIEAIAAPASLEFRGEDSGRLARPGDRLQPSGGTARFTVRASAPPGATTVLLRDGDPVAERGGGVLDYDATRPGVYRAEVRVEGAPGTPPVPWIVSNPIYWIDSPEPAGADPIGSAPAHRVPVEGEWHVEASPGSSGEVSRTDSSVTLRYALAPGPESSQFAALVVDLPAGPAADAIEFRARAERPMRVSVQLRFANDGGTRWVRSVYVDEAERDMRVPVDSLRPADSGMPRPPLARATSLLFVVDLTNAMPGARGSFTIADPAFTGR